MQLKTACAHFKELLTILAFNLLFLNNFSRNEEMYLSAH